MMSLDDQALNDLMEYLLHHENDIALDINDFGDLRYLFNAVVGRSAMIHHEAR